MSKKHYGPGLIKLREGIDHVRLRPSMYIGDIGESGLHHLISEVVDNSIDEALAGFCNKIEVTLHQNGAVSILDNGRGIPAGLHETGRSAIEVALTRIGAGGKFDKEAYAFSSGLHGVGVSCVNALSHHLEVEVYQDGKIHYQRYQRAIPQCDLQVLGDADLTGTKITFSPDPEIFPDCSFKLALISRRLRDLAFLNPGLEITLRKNSERKDSERKDEKFEELYHYPGGLKSFVHYLNGAEECLLREPMEFKRSLDELALGGRIEIECAIQYNSGYSEAFRSYVNGINTSEGGTHVSGFRAAFTAAFNLTSASSRRSEGIKA